MLVLELAEGGELFEYISKTGRFVPEACRTYFKQLISVIRYLNGINITHRDLKPENILFDKDYLLRVSDFGLSRDSLGPNRDYRLRSRVGTEGYKPMEMMQGNYTGLQADLFAAGVILFIMYNGTPPFLSTGPEDNIYRLIKTQNFNRFWALHEARKPPGFFPTEFKRLINSILSADVERRPTLEGLATDDWVRGDEMMHNQLVEYMSAKAQRLAERDPVKAQIAEIRRRLYERKSSPHLIQCKKTVTEIAKTKAADSWTLQLTSPCWKKATVFWRPSRNTTSSWRKKVVYVKQSPAYVVAWVETFLGECLKQKQTFMSDFVNEIVPKEYTLEYNP
jgi:serine/threonine protein kinase